MSTQAPERTRDARRSREAILDAAERLFAQRGFEGASLGDIGAEAGLSRGTPGYFFGAKEDLYRAVLERVFAARQEATAAAAAPIHAWCEAPGADVEALRRALRRALEDYMDCVASRPAFARVIAREELAGAVRLRAVRRDSTALQDAFAAVRAVARRRGLRAFDVEDAVLLFVALAYAPLAHEHTLMAALGRDLRDPPTRRHHVDLAAGQLMHLLSGDA